MEWESLTKDLENILQTKIRYDTVSALEWDKETWSRDAGDEIWFRLFESADRIHIMIVRKEHVSAAERQLVEMSLKLYHQANDLRHNRANEDEETFSLHLREWIGKQIDSGPPYEEMPNALLAEPKLNSLQIPIMIYRDSDHPRVSYSDLKKLLESFFHSSLLLIPLKEREWLILVPEEVMRASEETAEEHESIEELHESLESLCYGLHDMLTSEWVGECHLSISHPMMPVKEAVSASVLLRESVHLGRKFHFEQSLHFPWKLQLERLIYQLSEEDMRNFIVQIFGRTDAGIDQEMMITLDTFFELNCNVSETAKKLYIHRNTLLYRLEKFRQETGLDPRNFNQAVLVKIASLLYKITKRK